MFDFSTLYIKLPHDKVRTVLYKLIGFCFEGDNDSIFLNYFGTVGQLYFSKQDIKDAVNYILSNCYFLLGKKIFSQIIGILLGSDPA